MHAGDAGAIPVDLHPAGVEQAVGSSDCKSEVARPWWFDSTRRHPSQASGSRKLHLKSRCGREGAAPREPHKLAISVQLGVPLPIFSGPEDRGGEGSDGCPPLPRGHLVLPPSRRFVPLGEDKLFAASRPGRLTAGCLSFKQAVLGSTPARAALAGSREGRRSVERGIKPTVADHKLTAAPLRAGLGASLVRDKCRPLERRGTSIDPLPAQTRGATSRRARLRTEFLWVQIPPGLPIFPPRIDSPVGAPRSRGAGRRARVPGSPSPLSLIRIRRYKLEYGAFGPSLQAHGTTARMGIRKLPGARPHSGAGGEGGTRVPLEPVPRERSWPCRPAEFWLRRRGLV